MNMPARAVEIIHALYTANPQNDDERRVHIQRTAEQLVHELGPNWGNKKRAGLSDAFRSPDSIAYREHDGTISVWDVQASSGAYLVHPDKPADHPNLSPGDATFMPCQPVNHLGTPQQPDTDQQDNPPSNDGSVPPSNSGSVDLGPVLARIADLTENVAVLAALVQQLIDKPAGGGTVKFPLYEGIIDLGFAGKRAVRLEPRV